MGFAERIPFSGVPQKPPRIKGLSHSSVPIVYLFGTFQRKTRLNRPNVDPPGPSATSPLLQAEVLPPCRVVGDVLVDHALVIN